MSDGQRLRQLLTDIQRTISRLGATNRDRWMVFSPDTELTQQQFATRLSAFGISIRPQDVATLWRATDVPSDRMQFGDFVRFLQTEAIKIRELAPSTVSPHDLLDSMRGNRRAVLMKFVEADPSTTGLVGYRAFADVCSWFGSADNQSDVRQLIERYDPSNSGSVEYFEFMADLCRGDLPSPSSPYKSSPKANVQVESPRRENPRLDTSFARSPGRGYNTAGGGRTRLDPALFGEGTPRSPGSGSGGRGRLDPAIFGEGPPKSPSGESSGGRGRLDPAIFGQGPQRSPGAESSGGRGRLDPAIFGQGTPRSPGGESGGRGRLDPAIFGEGPPKSPSGESSGGRGRLDPAIFGQGTPRSPGGGSGGRGRLDPTIFGEGPSRSGMSSSGESSGGGRGRLDPSIFGQRSTRDDLPEQPVQHADDFVGAERMDGLTPTQLVEVIAKQVSRVSRGSKQCYTKWRGTNDLLDANDIRDGLARDANILVPLRDLQLIVSHYGGPMSMSTFVRMLGDGARYADQNSTIAGVKRASEDEAALLRIADQVIGTQWETMVLRARNAEEIARGFSAMGVHVSETEIGTLTSKLGKTGLVDAIKARIQ